MIHRIFTALWGAVLFPIAPLWFTCNLMLIACGIHGSCTQEDIDKYRAFKRGVVLFKSEHIFNRLVVMKELNEALRSEPRDVVLPIVIQYSPSRHYRMRVLDPVHLLHNETPYQFETRCQSIMMNEPLHDIPRAYCGSPLLFMTSFLFLICSYITWNRGPYAMGMILVFVTSVLNHGTGNTRIRNIDRFSNILMGALFSVRLILAGEVIPVMFATFAMCSFLCKLNHALFVHIPVCLGFLAIRG